MMFIRITILLTMSIFYFVNVFAAGETTKAGTSAAQFLKMAGPVEFSERQDSVADLVNRLIAGRLV